MIGSPNLNVRSEQMNSETMALIRAPGIARQLDGIFDYDLDTGSDRDLECGGRVYAEARPRRTLPVSLESMERRFREEGLWLRFLNLLRPVM
jgi:phosphatidylserine/phosphatidylglycerophosphate/cardiolipin synthase-like enzyme